MKQQASTLMTHLVAGYPDMDRSFTAAKAMIDGGAAYLELQFPFSDPSADGPTIQKACSDSLKAGFSLEKGFSLLRKIREYADIPVFLMNYGNVPFFYGFENFARRCRDEGVSGLIIPDMIIGRDDGLYETAAAEGVPVMPVIVPTLGEERLLEFISLAPPYLYIAMRTGITGKETRISGELLAFLDRFKGTRIKTLAGFGVRQRAQVKALEDHVHGIIVGSALVDEITSHIDADEEALYNAVKARVAGLAGG
ncbi:MAG: tryptophan synthase subunit alpha [Spirochaetales bacterium]|nr:tryptophan synthase subunit alpha [Spirochaetales bacterium]